MNQDLHALFAERFVRNENRVYRFIFSLVPRRSEAEELYQETSLTLWKTWERYQPDVDFVAWACGIAHNLVRNHLRKRKNQPRLLVDEQVLDQLAERRLQEDSALEERSMKQIAEGASQSPNAVYKHLRRIRALLYECAERKPAPGGAS